MRVVRWPWHGRLHVCQIRASWLRTVLHVGIAGPELFGWMARASTLRAVQCGLAALLRPRDAAICVAGNGLHCVHDEHSLPRSHGSPTRVSGHGAGLNGAPVVLQLDPRHQQVCIDKHGERGVISIVPCIVPRRFGFDIEPSMSCLLALYMSRRIFSLLLMHIRGRVGGCTCVHDWSAQSGELRSMIARSDTGLRQN